MSLTINGKPEVLEQTELTVIELLDVLKVETPDMVSVELNGVMLRRAEHTTTKVKDGDIIEFLYFMGGGR